MQQRGVKTVNIVRSADQVDALKQLGADAVVVFDAATFPDTVSRATEARNTTLARLSSADVWLVSRVQGAKLLYAIDAVGGEMGSAMARALAYRGTMFVYGDLSDAPVAVHPVDFLWKVLSPVWVCASAAQLTVSDEQPMAGADDSGVVAA
jgi:NADPH:quinone reductase-like Zn-dependent oxidoreductase